MPVFSQSPAQVMFMRQHFPDFVENLKQNDVRAHPKYSTLFSPVDYDMAGVLIDYYGSLVSIIEQKEIEGGFICVYKVGD